MKRVSTKTLIRIAIVLWIVAAVVASCSLHTQDKPVHKHWPEIIG